ncbi:MAG TPA: hypothetical protein VMM76_08850 [Pirellulaceae bacterium]|nr:hypothetical protein [Pirellulaceae bacterium]
MTASRLILSIALLSTCSRVFGQSTSLSEERSLQLKQIFHDVAAGYEITEGSGGELKQLPLRDEPIMHWLSLDGTEGTYLGSVFTWTRLQRPEVVGTIFTSDGTKEQIAVCEELYSFSSEQLQLRSGRGTLWRPAPGENMRRIPDAPIPSESQQGRRLQIRNMSRQFSGRMNRRGEPHPLRLLPRPIYQYESDDPNILSGALLVLVAYNTDPDILLLIEARQTAEGPRWFFQPARFSDKSLWLTFKESDIWISLRLGHGSDKPHADDLQYHVEFVTLDVPLKSEKDASETKPQ